MLGLYLNVHRSCTWSPRHILKIQKVETVQRKCAKRLSGYASLCYKERLSRLDLDSLEMRRLRHDLLYTYKIVFNLVSDSNFTSHVSQIPPIATLKIFKISMILAELNRPS